MTHVTCRLTAKDRDQLRNPTLGNQVWATFTFMHVYINTGEQSKTASATRTLTAVLKRLIKITGYRSISSPSGRTAANPPDAAAARALDRRTDNVPLDRRCSAYNKGVTVIDSFGIEFQTAGAEHR